MPKPKQLTEAIPEEVIVTLEAIDPEHPTPDDMKTYKRLLKQYPRLWKVLGDLAHQAQQGIVSELINPPLMQESVRVGIRELKASLEQAGDTQMERMLIDEIITNWLFLTGAENIYTQMQQKGMTLNATILWEKRLLLIQRRYLAPIQTLAKVRKLAQPVYQVNIGEKQVNIAQGNNHSTEGTVTN